MATKRVIFADGRKIDVAQVVSDYDATFFTHRLDFLRESWKTESHRASPIQIEKLRTGSTKRDSVGSLFRDDSSELQPKTVRG